MISETIISAVDDVVEQMLANAGGQKPERLKIIVEHPANLTHGDYSTNVAMQLAKTLKKPPMSIAGEIKERLLAHVKINALFYKIEVAAPGFINLYLDWGKWASEASRGAILPDPDRKSAKVLIEHTSINPNKSAHIGHLRNSCIGDTLARMLKRIGQQVEVHNYIDDLGNQLADTVVGFMHTKTEEPFARFGDFCWETYAKINKAYKANPDLQKERAVVLHELEQGSSNVAWLGLLVAERIVREHLEELKQFGVEYDVLVWESSIVREGFWSQAFELLRTTPIFRQETEGKLAGCWVLKQAEDGGSSADNEDFHADKVLVRSNGILTYTAKDIAYHLWKFGLLGKDFHYAKFTDRVWSTQQDGVKKTIGHADRVINVIDRRQEYPQAMVKQALLALGYEQQAQHLQHVSYGVVSLSPDTAADLGVDITERKHSYPMSGRQGIGIKVADLLDRMEQIIDAKRSRRTGLSSRVIAAAAIRYYLLKFHLQTEIVFDFEQATEISGNTGVYLLYSYARACSILDKVKSESGQTAPPAAFDDLELQEHTLLRQLAYWPEILHTAVQELAPNHICAYMHELATLFNHFYATCPILRAENRKKHVRVWLTERFRETLRDALQVLGLPTPKRM
ncbi:arginyl-tRNA synthetase [Gordoniibacillus kamchatkensis]|uniref:Arginine--tRNA ligase n=1 Tax=Gordoniibacillus kamchatkensis TaxID=1590651 RepID=A0ABR5ADI7_9BACL|nr:arginine--tRNA ligase [Paenibacillus sp. VKM B-2647]KIL39116.1 arginyl-tRNA synthetase [Paenibacillus sp. VKM B-2647]